MMHFASLCAVFCLLLLASSAKQQKCTKNDYVQQILPCNPQTLTRSVVYYLNSTICSGGEFPPKPTHSIPCTCPQGKGLTGDKPTNQMCTLCAKGEYGSGGEIISNWKDWTGDGTVPPKGSDIVTFCQNSSEFEVCRAWKASADKYTLDSGDNALSKCLVSVLVITKKFVADNSKVSFDYRVDSRGCRRMNRKCDGLGFFIDDQQVLEYTGNQFQWTTKAYNLAPGTHSLKWRFRKSCYSYGVAFVDKAFIRSITLVGTVEPNVKCKPCPPGTFGDQKGSSNCTACSYFQFQAKEGQQKCDPCPPNTFAMFGASKCIPLRTCTEGDIISAPANVSSCSYDGGSWTTFVQPNFVTVTFKGIKGRKVLCDRQKMRYPKLMRVPCRCQPGFEISQGADGKPQCKRCSPGMFSTGVKCNKCEAGHVALPGKHYFVWRKDTLPDGFTASCSGDCPLKTGWIPAGDTIRTERVVGDMHAELSSPTVEVESELSKIVFKCSVTCNMAGVPPTPVRGENLAEIQDCNLVFQVWSNGFLQAQESCTQPIGTYGHTHENRRDGENITHIYPLKKGTYSFRWVFHQQDKTRSLSAAYEAKVFHISILGAKFGGAHNCTACPPGQRSNPDNTECIICPNGTNSSSGSDTCTPCEGETFASQMGSETCLPCGNHTKALPNKDGCDTHGCTFSPTPGVEYDLNALSRPGGSMIFAYLHIPPPWSIRYRRRSSRFIWPTTTSYYINLCTVYHDSSSCTSFDKVRKRNVPLPVMACKSSSSSNFISTGSVIRYRAKKEIRSGLFVEFLQGDMCSYGLYGVNKARYKTTIDLRCDVTAGVGSPGPDSDFSVVEKKCEVFLVWKSLYACPKCRNQDIIRIKGECINGTRNITLLRSIPCWELGEYPGVNATTEDCAMPKGTFLEYRDKGSSNVNKLLIGVGVVVIVLLLGATLFFVYKHRVIKYRYETSMFHGKPMSRLEHEDDDDHFVQSDELTHSSNDTAAPLRTQTRRQFTT